MGERTATALFHTRIKKQLPIKDGAVLTLDDVAQLARLNAPYLDRLCEHWPQIIEQLRSHSPEQIYEDLLAGIVVCDYEELCQKLRQTKQQIHLLAALCDLAGVWGWAEVTKALSEFTDIAMDVLIQCVAQDMGIEGNERGPVPGLFILALGKYGGRELNYSSDIDLIVFYDPDHIKLPNPDKAERILVRFVKKLMRGFDDITADGYVFRTDLRLRPDPRANAVAVSTLTAERYYETLGQNWERAAMIKARYCGGDEACAQYFIDNVLRPFIWRRSLDYAAIADIHSIKRQIQGNAVVEDLQAAGHDIKLGIGGIREIEFYAQVQQLILGGRNKNLRAPRTIDALVQLGEGDYAKKETITRMINDYAALRDLEHRVQMYADEQTHIWPVDVERRQHLTHLSGYKEVSTLEKEMTSIFTRVHKTYTRLFPGEEDLSSAKGSLVFTGVEAEQPTLSTLEAYGFLRGPMVWKCMANWLGGRIRATRSERARELLTRLAPRIIEACGDTSAPDDTFFNFSEFVENLSAGVSMFSLFVNKPATLVALIEILSLAPRLAKTLARQHALIDAMVEPNFLTQKVEVSKGQYLSTLDADMDFETALNAIRRVVREDQFNLTTSILRLQNLDRAGYIFSAIAQATVEALLPEAVKETERLYGPITGEYAIIAMGKLGSQEMGLRSDLDIMLVYEAVSTAQDTGNNVAADPQGLFNKLTKRLITALSGVTSEGGLYEVDMALRPSGRSGPLAVSIAAFESYYRDKAWTWEYMALSRARVIAASSHGFLSAVSDKVKHALSCKDFGDHLATDILDMHARLARDKPAQGEWDIKGVAGGLRDIEFIAQYLMLKHKPFVPSRAPAYSLVDMLNLAIEQQWAAQTDLETLLKISKQYHRILQVLAISVESCFNADSLPSSVRLLLASATGNTEFSALDVSYAAWREKVLEIFYKTIS